MLHLNQGYIMTQVQPQRKVGLFATIGLAIETIYNSFSAVNNVAKGAETYTAVLPEMATVHTSTVLAELRAEQQQAEGKTS